MISTAARGIKRLLALGLLVSMIPTGALWAEEQVITVFRSLILPSALNVAVGDRVTWIWRSGEHVFLSGLPDDPEPGLLFRFPLNEAEPSFSLRMDRAGTIPFFAEGDPEQLHGVIIAQPFAFRVDVIDNEFDPDVVYIFAGDRVVWYWLEGSHTITSGLSSDPADQPGVLFERLSDTLNRRFEYPFESAGDFPYFCRPHEFMGMVGTIHVQDLFIRGEVDGSAGLGLADGILILSHIFVQSTLTCEDAADVNDNGVLNLEDAITLFLHIFLDGPALPAPQGVPGPDRTDDILRCDSAVTP